jgi:hypothetical protein
MLFVVFGLFNGLLVKSANASNNYIDNIQFFCGSDNLPQISFHVKTTFHIYDNFQTWYSGRSGWYCFSTNCSPSASNFFFNSVSWSTSENISGLTYTAGNTYALHPYFQYVADNTCVGRISSDYIQYFGGGHPTYWPYYISDDHPFVETDKIYFTEYPTLTITYPHDNDEIANIFNITGSFTQPAENPAGFLQADIMPTGIEISSLQSFWTSIHSATSGDFLITIGNVPIGYYDFRIYFRGGAFDFYQGALISNIHIVNDLPPFKPPWEEQPPTTAPIVFEPIATSTFSTSTGLYTQMTNTFAPVLFSIVSNLQQFSSNFTQSNASSTGNQIGQSILLVRSYLSNLNSFFGNFPVSQFLLLYLIALVVVIVLRLIKGLINLFKI